MAARTCGCGPVGPREAFSPIVGLPLLQGGLRDAQPLGGCGKEGIPMDRYRKFSRLAGVCSRRCRGVFAAGRITVNGQTVGVGAKRTDAIKLDGKTSAIPHDADNQAGWKDLRRDFPDQGVPMLNKPGRYVTTLSTKTIGAHCIDLTADSGERYCPSTLLDRIPTACCC